MLTQISFQWIGFRGEIHHRFLITCMALREAGELRHDNAGGSRKLSAVAVEHTMQVKELHYEKEGRTLSMCMKAIGVFFQRLWRGPHNVGKHNYKFGCHYKFWQFSFSDIDNIR